MAVATAAYNESLTVRPLPGGLLLNTFSFNSSQNVQEVGSFTAYDAFPRSLGQIVQRAKASELHLRMGGGWWDAESWGAEPDDGVSGAEVWARISGESQSQALENWHRLVSDLSGYFCASLNFIDSTKTAWPSSEVFASGNENKGWLLHGVLPGEPVCTENLTPFLKLLPCKGQAGVASLMDGHRIFDSMWDSISVNVVRDGSDWRLEQRLSHVVDVDHQLKRNKSPLPVPEPVEDLACDPSVTGASTCFPLPLESLEFRLSDIYGRKLAKQCPIDSRPGSRMVFDAPAGWEYQIENDDMLLKSENLSLTEPFSAPPVFIDRSFSGWGQQKGGIRMDVHNPTDKPVELIYYEVLPWFLRVYLHTMSPGVQILNYVAAKDRGRPTQLEMKIALMPHGTKVVEYEFDRSLLYLEEYPPDANYGFELAPAKWIANGIRGKTTSLLVSLPVPDFSMPYNVIILSSTVMGLAFGTLFNLLTKHVVPET